MSYIVTVFDIRHTIFDIRHLMPSLSIVIPAYNEEPRLAVTLQAIEASLSQLKDAGLGLQEVLVCDDGSKDRTVDIAGTFEGRLPVIVHSLPQNRGKGAAVRMGMLKAVGDFVLMYDADGATPMSEVPHLFRELQQKHADIAIGSRVSAHTQSLVTMSWHRRIIGRTYHALCHTLVPGIHDTACGCKLFTQVSAKHLFSLQKIDRFAFDVEVLSLALIENLKIAEVPVQWTAVPESKVRIIRDGLEMFWCVVRLYVRRVGKGRFALPKD